MEEASSSTAEEEYTEGVRAVLLNLPEDEGEGLGFRLTRTLWDPYPWVHEVTPDSRADIAGLKTGDCLLQADGKDLLGMPVAQVAGLIRGDGAGRGVSLLVWNCGVNPKDDPELLWSCGGGARGEKARRVLARVVRALACAVCGATAAAPLCCARSHLYCQPCWMRLERCALCRELLPSKASPYSRNLIAEQVFEAIATEYELKKPKSPKVTTSAHSSPNRSTSPSPNRRGQYQHSLLKHKRTVHFNEKFGQTYASDPNIHRSLQQPNPPNLVKNSAPGNSANGANPCCQNENQNMVENKLEKECNQSQSGVRENERFSSCQNLTIPHKLVARLRQACSLVDLQNAIPACSLTRSLTNLGDCQHEHRASLDNLNNNVIRDSPVYLIPAPPIYVVTCDHNSKE